MERRIVELTNGLKIDITDMPDEPDLNNETRVRDMGRRVDFVEVDNEKFKIIRSVDGELARRIIDWLFS